MSPRLPQEPPQQIDPAILLRPPSLRFSLLGILGGCALMALATWSGASLRGDLPEARERSANPLQVVDSTRAVIFNADPATGDVRVLSVRSGVSEIARLHESRRHDVAAISLDTQGRILTVESANERYQYDAHSFRLLTRSPLLAAGSPPDREL